MHWQAASVTMCTARPFIRGIGVLLSTYVFIGAYSVFESFEDNAARE